MACKISASQSATPASGKPHNRSATLRAGDSNVKKSALGLGDPISIQRRQGLGQHNHLVELKTFRPMHCGYGYLIRVVTVEMLPVDQAGRNVSLGQRFL